MQRMALIGLAALLLPGLAGCSSFYRQMAARHEVAAEKKQAKHEFMDECRARKVDELGYRRDMLAAEREARKDEFAKQFEDRLKSKLAIDLSQKINISDVKVDMDRMKSMIAQAEQAEAAHTEAWGEYQQLQQEKYKEQMKAYTRGLLAQSDQQFATENACSAPKTACGCAQPPPCAPQAPAFRPAPMPSKRLPLSQLPLVLEVTVDLGASNPRIEQARTRKLPSEAAKRACYAPCGECEGCKSGGNCVSVGSNAPIFRSDLLFPPPAPVGESDEDFAKSVAAKTTEEQPR